MSMKVVLVAAASVMAVSPALAMSKSQAARHTGGPIPYSQLVSMDKSGYNARSHKTQKASATTGAAVAANSAAAGAAPAPDGSADAAANGAATTSAAPAPASAPAASPQ